MKREFLAEVDDGPGRNSERKERDVRPKSRGLPEGSAVAKKTRTAFNKGHFGDRIGQSDAFVKPGSIIYIRSLALSYLRV